VYLVAKLRYSRVFVGACIPMDWTNLKSGFS
jgi:hypothetical protein